MYMPGEKQVNKDFLKDVFEEKKKLLKKREVDYILVPDWSELAVNKLWPQMKSDAAFNIYFQDEYPDAKGPCREYFFNILNTVYPDYLEKIMSHASKERFSAEGIEQQRHVIKASDEWFEALKNLPFKSSKYCQYKSTSSLSFIETNGRTLHLLKASSKKIEKNKKRKVIPLLGTIQDWHQSKRKPQPQYDAGGVERIEDQLRSSLEDNGG